MSMEAKFNEINLKNKLNNLLCDTDIECGTTIPISAANQILAISSCAALIGEEVLENQIKFSGRVIFACVYENESGQAVKYECGSEFQNKIEKDGVTSANEVKIGLRILKVTTAEKNGFVLIKCKVSAEITVLANCSAKYLSGGEFYTKKAEKTAITSKIKKGVYPLDEEFELNYAVNEVLLHQSEIGVLAVTSGVGAIIVDGELILSLCLLQKIENSDILKETKIIPFRLELEAEETLPSSLTTATASVKGVKLDISVDEESGKSVVKLNAAVELVGAIYEENKIEYAEDCYSDKCEMLLNKENLSFIRPTDKKVFEERLSVRGNFGAPLAAGARLMCVGLEKVTPTSVRNEAGNVLIDGVVEAVAFIKDADGKISSAPIEAPLSIRAAFDIADDYDYDLKIINASARIVSLETFEADIRLKLIVDTYSHENIEVIKSLEFGEEKVVNKEAMSVYIPLAGEELWDVAKRLNSCPEVIMEINSDLTFPLTGEERLIIYRQEKKAY